jgi:hypothetical protein
MLGVDKRTALIVLSVWLILTGFFGIAAFSFSGLGLILNILAIAAGVLILLQGRSWTADIGMILLGIWLVATGLLGLIDLNIPGIGLVLNILVIVAGVLILLKADNWSEKIGMILLGIWLVATGLLSLINLGIQGIDLVLNILAIAAGVLILMKE